VDIIAKKLGFSRQTLFRRFKVEGATFEKVLDESRHKLALHYLSGEKVSVKRSRICWGSPNRPRSRAHSRGGPDSVRARCASKIENDHNSVTPTGYQNDWSDAGPQEFDRAQHLVMW
jgi:methylphosphotriester-DNA--protein-cysteine methyltransferase